MAAATPRRTVAAAAAAAQLGATAAVATQHQPLPSVPRRRYQAPCDGGGVASAAAVLPTPTLRSSMPRVGTAQLRAEAAAAPRANGGAPRRCRRRRRGPPGGSSASSGGGNPSQHINTRVPLNHTNHTSNLENHEERIVYNALSSLHVLGKFSFSFSTPSRIQRQLRRQR